MQEGRFETDVLLRAMQEVNKQRKALRFQKYMQRLHLLRFGVGTVGVFRWHWNGGLGGMLGMLSFIPNMILQKLDSKSRKALVNQLAEGDDVRIVGPMCNVVSFQDPQMRKLALEALPRLLPRVSASDVALLNDEQRKLLFTTLYSEDARIVLTTLKALEQIGNAQALPYAEKLAQGKYAAKVNSEVKQAAVDCLPFLLERIEQNRVASDLLRPSQPGTSPGTLLCPANSEPEVAPQQLLRAANQSE